jgi:hypothetical protein
MAQERDFAGLFSRISQKILAEPMPDFPRQPLGRGVHFTKKSIADFAEGKSEFGYPVTEFFLDSSVIRLLVKFDVRRKYAHCLKSNFLLGLKVLEETADLPIDYCLNIADVINHPEIPIANVAAAQALMRTVKSTVTAFVGLEFQKDVRQLRFITDLHLEEIRFYHDRNEIKSGARAQELVSAIFTRMALGDENCRFIPDGIQRTIQNGMAAYALRYLNQPDTRSYAPITLGSAKRHLL